MTRSYITITTKSIMQSLTQAQKSCPIAYSIKAHPGVWDPPTPVPSLSLYNLHLSHTRFLTCPKLITMIGSGQCAIFQPYARCSKSLYNLQDPDQKSAPLCNLLPSSFFEFIFPFFELPGQSVSIIVVI